MGIDVGKGVGKLEGSRDGTYAVSFVGDADGSPDSNREGVTEVRNVG